MKLFRQIFFWLHLAAGLLAGLVIAVLCFTGAALAFEKELIAWADHAHARVTVPAEATRLTLDELQQRLRAAQPEARPATVVVQNDPAAAVVFSSGREGGFYVNPYTGEVSAQGAAGMRAFMRTMTDWHRWLGRNDESARPLGKAVTGVSNFVFLFLALSGLYLWWPRAWSWRGVKAVAVFNVRLAGKARDFNWHNSLGLWCAPVLIVLTLTALPISYRWAGNLIYTFTGETAPAQAAGPGAGPTVEVPVPPAGTKRLDQNALLAAVQTNVSGWEQITLRTGGAQRRRGGGEAGAPRGEGQRPAGEPRADGGREARASRSETAAAGSNATPAEGMRREGASPRGTESAEPRGPQAATATVRIAGTWPRTATTTLSLDPFTGAVLKREGYADLGAARQIRSWTRFLHTGEALGWGGQLVAGLACLGGLFLCYTGFALSWRRFFKRKSPAPTPAD